MTIGNFLKNLPTVMFTPKSHFHAFFHKFIRN